MKSSRARNPNQQFPGAGRRVKVEAEGIPARRKTNCAQVAYRDPQVPVIRPSREHSHWAGMKSVKWHRPLISRFDVVVIATAHDAVDYQQLAGWSPLIVDTRNVMANCRVKPGQVWKA